MTRRYHDSSLGRIWLLLRLDYALYRKQMFIGAMIFFLAGFFLPRLPLLWGEDYYSWSGEYARSNIYGLELILGWFVAFFYWLVYLNRRIQHPQTMPFSLLPHRRGELIVASLIVALGVWAVLYFVVQAIQILSWCTLSVEMELQGYILPLDNMRGFVVTHNLTGILPLKLLADWSMILVVLLLFVWGSISFRHILSGWLISFALLLVGGYVISDPVRYVAKHGPRPASDPGVGVDATLLSSVHDRGLNWTLEQIDRFIVGYIALVGVLLLCLISWLIYRKIKTIAQ